LIESVELESSHPLKLATALNFAVFFYEIRFDVYEALDVAKKYFNECLTVFSTLEQEQQDATMRIMVVLQNNIEIWELDLLHFKKLQDKEQFKQLHKKLAEHGVKVKEEDAGVQFGDYTEDIE
jgi:hypothetical protein